MVLVLPNALVFVMKKYQNHDVMRISVLPHDLAKYPLFTLDVALVAQE